MWKSYYRRQPGRLFALLVQAQREQAGASWPRAVAAALLLAHAAAAFGKTGWDGSAGDPSRRDDPGYLRDIARAYRLLGLPDGVDAREVARLELRWWTVRREIGLASGQAAGAAIAALYSKLYGLPVSAVAEAGRLRGQAAEFRDRGSAVDPEGPRGCGAAYWPEVGRFLVASYRSLKAAIAPGTVDTAEAASDPGRALSGRGRRSRRFGRAWRSLGGPGLGWRRGQEVGGLLVPDDLARAGHPGRRQQRPLRPTLNATLVAVCLSGRRGAGFGRFPRHRPNRRTPHEGLASVHVPLASHRHGERSTERLLHRRLRGPGRARRLVAHPGREQRVRAGDAGGLRLARRRGERAAQARLVPEPDLRRQPPFGHGARRGVAPARTCSQARGAASRRFSRQFPDRPDLCSCLPGGTADRPVLSRAIPPTWPRAPWPRPGRMAPPPRPNSRLGAGGACLSVPEPAGPALAGFEPGKQAKHRYGGRVHVRERVRKRG